MRLRYPGDLRERFSKIEIFQANVSEPIYDITDVTYDPETNRTTVHLEEEAD